MIVAGKGECRRRTMSAASKPLRGHHGRIHPSTHANIQVASLVISSTVILGHYLRINNARVPSIEIFSVSQYLHTE